MSKGKPPGQLLHPAWGGRAAVPLREVSRLSAIAALPGLESLAGGKVPETQGNLRSPCVPERSICNTWWLRSGRPFTVRPVEGEGGRSESMSFIPVMADPDIDYQR